MHYTCNAEEGLGRPPPGISGLLALAVAELHRDGPHHIPVASHHLFEQGVNRPYIIQDLLLETALKDKHSRAHSESILGH